MDALARLAPVARPLLRLVDNALATLGAPAEHPVWDRLRRLGTTPADAVAFLADLEPARLRTAAGALRRQAEQYAIAAVPVEVASWDGSAAEAYAGRAAGLAGHLHDEMAGRLRATASYVDGVADAHAAAREALARRLAAVLGSTQAMAVRSQPALGGGLAELLRDGGSGQTLAIAVRAAADIGEAVLEVVDDAIGRASELRHRWSADLSELTYQPRTPANGLSERQIRFG